MTIKFYSKIGVYLDHSDTSDIFYEFMEDGYEEYADKFAESINGRSEEQLAEEDLAQYATIESDGFDSTMVPSIRISVEGCTLVATVEIVGDPQKIVTYGNRETALVRAIGDYLEGQYADGWGESIGDDSIGVFEDWYTEPGEPYEDENGDWVDDEDEEVSEDVYVHPVIWWNDYLAPGLGDFKFEKIDIITRDGTILKCTLTD